MGPLPTQEGECFWLSLAGVLGDVESARRKVAAWLRCNSHRASGDAGALEAGCLTTEWHVNATVQANPGAFPNGLIVFHEPRSLGVHYCPKSLPCVLDLPSAVAMCCQSSRYARPPAILYTEANELGHFEMLELTLSTSREWLAQGETDQWPDLLPLPMLGGMDRSAPMQTLSAFPRALVCGCLPMCGASSLPLAGQADMPQQCPATLARKPGGSAAISL